ncbi:putative export-related chaperone CsaA [Megalodesulfovibrio gigas DSM 1382 = ATCC 19364]|uniref:Putative export-related chaperone CsaA n=2 Tax=Megalodesulfovibrio gigas TaxID=879 RepID=T2G9Q1_MEGG1|nr:putative export-related chaperone CsaA [Megalodesulfovibrio gigas DSM 1382 = ATCC 19364]
MFCSGRRPTAPGGGMQTISWNEFELVELRTGTVLDVQEFPQARTPAYIITVDFGDEIGVKKTSARVTHLYSRESLVGRQVLGVVNFPPRQIGPVRSEFLLTGFVQGDGSVVLAVPERPVANGLKLA